MTTISASLVKELRARTGSGIMECKQALTENNGDIELAVEAMRKAGLAKADKKSSRVAAEGTIAINLSEDKKTASLVEVNCETDFVAKGEQFQNFAESIAKLVSTHKPKNVADLLKLPLGNSTVEDYRVELVAKIGENMSIRRFTCLQTDNQIFHYKHGLKIGVIVDTQNADEELGKGIAMHIAAYKPIALSPKDIPSETIAKEKEVFEAQAEESNKPKEIIERMINGKLNKFMDEVSLLKQPYVKNNELSVQQLLDQKNANITNFAYFVVGEGIDKKEVDFAEEVKQQVDASKSN